MYPHFDIEMTEVTVILDVRWENKLEEAVAILQTAGLRVIDACDDSSVVNGDIPSEKLHDLEKLDCVDYVRRVFTWSAEFPKDDPRDRNNR
jgi:hypothetical protein